MNKKCDSSLQYCADYAIRIRQFDEDLAANARRLQKLAESNRELETSMKTMVAEAQDFGN
jgi:cell division protein FtsB